MDRPEEVCCVIGTRPEVIKMAPVILEFQRRNIICRIVATGQHDTLFEDAMDTFGLKADANLGLMREGQTPVEFLSRALAALSTILDDNPRVGVILAQGDTTTVLAAAMVAFHKHIPFGHVEAGLRTYDLDAPFPEEYNRRLVAIGAKWHFAPTAEAVDHLTDELAMPMRFDGGAAKCKSIIQTGNTVVDALKLIINKFGAGPTPHTGTCFGASYVLITCHRRENLGEPMDRIFTAISLLAHQFENTTFWYPLHPNPVIGIAARKILGDIPNVILSSALPYVDCVKAINGAKLVITDSGGIQEEAISLGVPALVTRETTERPEGVQSGGCVLVGTDVAKITSMAATLLTNPSIYDAHVVPAEQNPYGDGKAAARIVDVIQEHMEAKDAKL